MYILLVVPSSVHVLGKTSFVSVKARKRPIQQFEIATTTSEQRKGETTELNYSKTLTTPLLSPLTTHLKGRSIIARAVIASR